MAEWGEITSGETYANSFFTAPEDMTVEVNANVDGDRVTYEFPEPLYLQKGETVMLSGLDAAIFDKSGHKKKTIQAKLTKIPQEQAS